MSDYVRLTFKTIGGGKRTVWAEVVPQKRGAKARMFFRVDQYGSQPDRREIIILADGDVLRCIPAIMNLHYGELEKKS